MATEQVPVTETTNVSEPKEEQVVAQENGAEENGKVEEAPEGDVPEGMCLHQSLLIVSCNINIGNRHSSVY